MTYNAAQRKDIRRAEKSVEAAELARIDFLRAAMTTTQGRAWFWNLLEFCHLFADPFSGNALLEAYTKGERNVGLRIFADILTHCPESYTLMVREAHITETTNDRRAEHDHDHDSRAAAPELAGSPDADGGAEGSELPADDGGWNLADYRAPKA